jgi:DNA-binding NtrC family response regulator
MAALQSYDWPGNVRELRNVLERALHMTRAAGSSSLTLVEFPPARRAAPASADDELASLLVFGDDMTYREIRGRFDAFIERRYVRWLLDRHGGNISAAARHAKMDRNHLTDLVRRHGLERRRG